ncbi:hypothetical protein P4U05_20530 [Bacillus paranthracis]|uniref:hypothetical protein n=1 Tax=Bacillus cereus group TaxID=86661 RepID=UPI000200F1F5|nr:MULTISPECIES: hypothetical protein [Bacillus cereus group]ADY24852.1 hypothetical protein YBT020_28479 [Bacillus thuringiensis serovar finitimus YBT-020]MRC74004.1 hypothetical protein [Bacillus thuringiensis]OTX71539.1 hypothetical protein BK722_12215 [Bacillus thuringiensis serovar finitimus]KAA0781270.1 hypothetical protein DN393_30100 [Bacillus sp. BPN334]MEC3360534.1 hypothetical protein [Bacillus paranthracis]
MAKFSKPVAFNEKNEKDRLMLKHVKRRNFSGYAKKLIWEDMKKEGKIQENQSEQHQIMKQDIIQESGSKSNPISHKPTASERIKKLKEKTKKQQASPSSLPFIPSIPQKH